MRHLKKLWNQWKSIGPASVSRIFFRCLIFVKKERSKIRRLKKFVKTIEVKLRSKVPHRYVWVPNQGETWFSDSHFDKTKQIHKITTTYIFSIKMILGGKKSFLLSFSKKVTHQWLVSQPDSGLTIWCLVHLLTQNFLWLYSNF